MLNILGSIPKTHFHVACSGGSDSMVLVDFLMKYPKNDFDLLYFNHGTECCAEAERFLMKFSKEKSVKLHVGNISRGRGTDESQEEYWRKERYAFLSKFSGEPILMAHHLNDCIETWIMTSLTGRPRVIPYCNRRYNVFRPLLAVPKSEIKDWAERHGVEYVYDRSNSDTSLRRNYVRHVMMENVRHVNPGIELTVRKLVLHDFAEKFGNEKTGKR